ncbi:MAG: UbiA family prenyltransferase [Thermoproteota archaeon]|nr:UbiA prenyltransferase family protein [Candidatus Brockarchaeota archaeon]MBO3801262.1 UbiA prenyltransferase family protein [Candidatus Brockarchaeota archaeon]
MIFKIIRNFSYRINVHLANFRIFDWKAYLFVSVIGSLATFELSKFDPFKYILFIALICSYLAFSFSINNIFDKHVDSLDKVALSKNPVAGGKITEIEALTLSFLMPMVSLPASIIVFGIKYFLVYTFAYALSTMYSAPPFRLKGKPIIDLVVHGIFFGVLPFLLGALIIGSLNALSLSLGLSFFLYSIFLELRNHIEDYDFDSLANIKTTAVVIGKEKSEKIKEVVATAVMIWLVLSAVALKLYWSLAVVTLALLCCDLLGLNKDRKIDITFVLATVSLILEAIFLSF